MSQYNINETLQIAFDRGGYNKELFSKIYSYRCSEVSSKPIETGKLF